MPVGERPTITVVIPVYNEENSVADVVSDLLAWIRSNPGSETFEVIVVDDASTDRSRERLKAFPQITVLHHSANRGYGAALRTGIRNASGEIIVTMDSDGQHAASNIARLLAAMDGHDLISGSRETGDRGPAWRKPGKRVLRSLISHLVGIRVPDFNCGFRAFRRDVAMRYVHLCPTGFSFSTTLLVALLRQGCSVGFCPIAVRRREPGSRSRVTVAVGLETMLLYLRLVTLFSPLRLFLPASLASTLLGLVWGAIRVFAGAGLSVAGLLFLVTGLLLFFFGLVIDQISAMRREKFE